MSSNPTGKPTSAVAGVLSVLSETNGYVTIGLEAAGVIVPLVKGLITEIKKIGGGAVTEQYQVLITTDLAELDDVTKLATDDLTAINAELARLGKPTVMPSPEALQQEAQRTLAPGVPATISPASEAQPGPAADPAPGSNTLT